MFFILQTEYYKLVFTVPEELYSLIYSNLFKSETSFLHLYAFF